MTVASTSESSRPPKHLRIVGAIALLWNAMGAFDYLMTETRNDAYMRQFSPEQLAYFYGFPAWVVGSWAIAVWGGVLAAVLLLLRRRQAVPVFLVAFVAMVVTMVHNYGLADGLAVAGSPFALAFSALIVVSGLAFWRYARAMDRRGLLR